MIIHGTTWIGGDMNNNKKGYMELVTKSIRKYVKEMKAKYNKEYEHLNFDETIEQKQEEEKKQKEIEECTKKRNGEKIKITSGELDIFIQEFIYKVDLPKKNLNVINYNLIVILKM